MNSLKPFSFSEEKKFSEVALLIEWCPTMDLIALVTNTNDLLLYRYRGQKVWAIRTRELKENIGKITTISWRPDGQVLAIGFSSGSVSLCSVQEGKIIHNLSPSIYSIICTSWNERMFQPKHSLSLKPKTPRESVSNHLLELPKLPNIKTTGTFYHLGTSQSQKDAVGSESSLDVLLAVDSRGNIACCLDGTYMLGILENYVFAMHPPIKQACSTDQSLLAILAIDDVSSLRLSYQRIALLPKESSRLVQITKFSTRITGIIAYIKEAINNLQMAWKVARDVARTHVLQFQNSLIAHGVGDSVTPVPELFQLLLTGIPSAPTRDWLLSDLTERGLKGWEKTLNTTYDHLRNLVHDNILLACDHLSVLLTELKGIVKWDFLLHAETIDGPLLALKDLFSQSHKFLLELNKDMEAFQHFATWLKTVFDDVQQTEVSETMPEFNPSEVVSYIKERFNDSPLDHFLCQKDGDNMEVCGQTGIVNPSPEGLLSKAASKLSTSCKTIYEGPAKNVSGRISTTNPITILPQGENYLFDVCVLANDDQLMIAFSSQIETTCLYVTSISFSGNVLAIAVDLTEAEECLKPKDFCFLENGTLLVLASKCAKITGEPKFDQVPYTLLGCMEVDLFSLGPLQDSTSIGEMVMKKAPIVSPVWSRKSEFIGPFQPHKLAINYRQGKRIGCMLAQDGQTHVIFGLDD